jgi:NADP-dependent 3-hydroxy acid dehydrogenase YdfG
MMQCLQGKIAIVTGASSGMGRAIAAAMAAEGATLGLVARSRDGLEATASQARVTGSEVVTFPGDVADNELARYAVSSMVGRFGRIDILVNNAGTNTYHRNLADTSVEDWYRVMNTNITGAFLFTRQVLPHMRKEGRGQIINISSGAGLQPGAPGGVAYCASKHAMHSLNGSINLEERRHGVRACVIVPGETNTPNLALRPRPPAEESLAAMLRPEDIGSAVVYVAGQPDHVAVEMLVITPTVRRNYAADYERYVAEGHTNVPLD